MDGAGNLYIADTGNHRIRKLSLDGIITTVAGDGTAAYGGDGGLASNARLSAPEGVAVDGAGNLYIADTQNNRIRKISSNTPPVVNQTIPSQTATLGQAFSYTLPANAFTDNQTLTYSVSINPANGLTYTPSTNVISGTPTVAGSSSVTVVATDQGGLSSSQTFTITTRCSVVSATINGSLTVCTGQSTMLTASGGAAYIWSTGATTESISATAGTYSVTVTSASGCSATATTTVTGSLGIPTATLTNDGPLTCIKSTVTLTASGGVSYQFSSGTTQVNGSSTATVTASAPYSVTVTDANGCSATATTGVESNLQVPNATLTNNGPLSCTQTSVSLTASGGVSYVFTGVGLTQTGTLATINVITAGMYSVTVTNAGGCSATVTTTVMGSLAVPTAILTNNGPLSCSKSIVTLTASGGVNYQFSAGATQVNGGNTATVTTSAPYSVTVTDANGCSATATTGVESNLQAPTLSITPSSTTLSSTTPTASLTANGAGAFRWSTGETTQVISVSATGTYSVTLTTGGCSATAMASVEFIGGGDLTPILRLLQANFTASGPESIHNMTMTLSEQVGKATSGVIVLTLTAPLGYSLSFDPTQTSINVTGGNINPVAVNNAIWEVRASNGLQLTLVSKTGQGIPANGTSVIGLSLSRVGASVGTANLTVNDDATNGYDSNSANNIYVRILNSL